eukprot:CAMPEP_0197928622 /NCGR_PEP_ID=MMETSP1439-20131203/102670_1 /TAXON_ID=66791 /ORGANISM="Gonyaulax spinifera, Strain CCMP409" /LENGTH=154 /DNA_ID=CAMNT_0043551233 /DNA_START=72 /DNA_END=536 /DNA_ORIENTATION=+
MSEGAVAAPGAHGVAATAGSGEGKAQLLRILVKQAEKQLQVRRLRQRPELWCGVVNNPGSMHAEVAAELLESLGRAAAASGEPPADLVCIFEVGVASGDSVSCRLFGSSASNVDMSEVAALHGGAGSPIEGVFTVPDLHAFQRLWAAETAAEAA